MGTVWEAYDEYLHRPVAVKEVRLPPGVPQAEADELRERTLREARAIAVLAHPNVITLHDVAREDGEPFVVMEYMRARSLADLIKSHGPLATAQAAAIADAVAAALQAAHQAGITHRDVKPGNVLVGEDGRVKLTDFGIARNVSERTMTRTGIMLGSPAFIAPEVATGDDVTPAADLWGLGATLFAAVEGRAPYDPDGEALATISAVVHGDIPQPESTGPLREVITALMVKDPNRRIDLAEMRRRIFPLLPEPDRPLFTTEEFHAPLPDEPEHDETDLIDPVSDAEAPAAPPTPPLAPDPGPLPFRTAPHRTTGRRRRTALARTFVVLTAIVLFVIATAAGFAATRTLGGKELLPPAAETGTNLLPGNTAPIREAELQLQPADASTLKGSRGGGFMVTAPKDWAKFVEQRENKSLLSSVRVHFVSPDGKNVLAVERFPMFFPGRTVRQYIDALRAGAGGQDFRTIEPRELPPRSATGEERPTQLDYRTAERGASSKDDQQAFARRTTFSQIIPLDADLWVISLTVPIEAENSGRDLFTKIAPMFMITG
ncbi:serine/threonine-protein kinase [Herbihabitans rhizosphaerae]